MSFHTENDIPSFFTYLSKNIQKLKNSQSPNPNLHPPKHQKNSTKPPNQKVIKPLQQNTKNRNQNPNKKPDTTKISKKSKNPRKTTLNP